MDLDTRDLTGRMRRPDEFEEARKVIEYRLIHMSMLHDPQLAVQLPTILEALNVAVRVAKALHEDEPP